MSEISAFPRILATDSLLLSSFSICCRWMRNCTRSGGGCGRNQHSPDSSLRLWYQETITSESSSHLNHKQIARLAYEWWERKGGLRARLREIACWLNRSWSFWIRPNRPLEPLHSRPTSNRAVAVGDTVSVSLLGASDLGAILVIILASLGKFRIFGPNAVGFCV